jgi:predicted RNA binding protein YcfA (HicA-like mRNA interferase family)
LSIPLPCVTATEVIRVLLKIDFFLTRQSGSHRIYKNALGRRVTVPFHSGQTLHPKLIKSILTEAQLTVEEFVLLLQE